MNLVIVESPAKSKTIEKYLGKDYKVLASFGHVRDLPEKSLGIDVKNNYAPEYGVLAKAKKTISALKEYSKTAKIIYLATDLDREGEAISWHLTYALGLKANDPRVKRIVFNEITKTAVEKAIANPRTIDINLVDAQQARRVLDRLVGYKLSPLLWKKVKTGLSAGRVQSVAVRMVVEREREIEAFVPVEYWMLGANLTKINQKQIFKAMLSNIDGKDVKKFDIKTSEQANDIEKQLTDAKYQVIEIEKRESIRKPAAPFTTSTLQMEASRRLGFSPKQTMMVAQKLYESGKITYMRTDSTNLSVDALAAIREAITVQFGADYLMDKGRNFQTKTKHAQEAHEAIRPTHFNEMRGSEDGREQRLYELIWKRTVASQMKDAIFDVVTAKIAATAAAHKFIFTASGETMRFDGFMKLYLEATDDDAEGVESKLPKLTENEELDFSSLIKDQKFTEPPKRYTEATLVKKMENLGIGRPSTYAPTLDTIQNRGYVELREKKFWPTDIARIVTDLLVNYFDKVVDYKFTAKMEDEFDDIAEGKQIWTKVIDAFYKPFEKTLEERSKDLNKSDIMPVELLDEKCPECGEQLAMKHGRYGKFIACSSYPKCKYSRPLDSKSDEKLEVLNSDGKTESIEEAEASVCEKCGGKMVLKEGRFGKFLACEKYPECKNTKAVVAKTDVECPECHQGELVERRTRKGKIFWSCSRYPECKYATWNKPVKAEEASQSDK